MNDAAVTGSRSGVSNSAAVKPLHATVPLLIPWWLRRQIRLQCGRPRFDPWVGKIPSRREWLPTPVFLPGEFHGQRSLEGYSLWVSKSQTWLSDQHRYNCKKKKKKKICSVHKSIWRNLVKIKADLFTVWMFMVPKADLLSLLAPQTVSCVSLW